MHVQNRAASAAATRRSATVSARSDSSVPAYPEGARRSHQVRLGRAWTAGIPSAAPAAPDTPCAAAAKGAGLPGQHGLALASFAGRAASVAAHPVATIPAAPQVPAELTL